MLCIEMKFSRYVTIDNASMKYAATSIRPFIGAKNYQLSRQFYCELGFEQIELSKDMCLFKVNEQLSFYLQDYYVKNWVNNSMVFLEVEDIVACWADLNARDLQHKYEHVRLSEVKQFDWGDECFLHDPSGILWHFGQFKQK